MLRPMIAAAALCSSAIMSLPAGAQIIDYPETRRGNVIETPFGEPITDPYRWLENDVREDDEVAQWVTAQNEVTDAYLATVSGRDVFADKLRAFIDYERYGIPRVRGDRVFYEYNSGLQNQAVLMVRDGDGEARVLIDPNQWAEDGTIALAEWKASPDGKYLLYAEQDGGSDWRTLRVLNAETGEALPDTIEWVKFSALAWDGDGEGFFYSRFAEPEEGAEFQSLNLNQSVYRHRLGTAQAKDELVLATPEEPKLGHTATVSADGRWLVIYSRTGTEAREEVRVADLERPSLMLKTIVADRDAGWSLAGTGTDGELYFVTDRVAPRGRIVMMDGFAGANPPLTEIVPQGEDVLDGAVVKGNVIVADYLSDVKSALRRFDLDGNPVGDIDLPSIGTVSIAADEGEGELFYGFSSFTVPGRIYRYDLAANESTVWAEPDVAFDPDAYSVEQRFYASTDGTRIPMFIVRRADNESGPQPTLLYGYGGFNVSLTPGFSATRMAWIDAGGTLAVANLRGGGEYGKAWHDGGRRANKQNVFDDFIAAGEYLISEGLTSADRLAIQGGSNGGLLVGAVVNQRPDLFAAALPAVGVMDMLRFDRFTAGRYWVDDYGYPDREEDWRLLRAYSPLHNIADGADYPAILVTTADTDDRVVPGHSFKYAAAIQAADIGDEPHLIRVETRAGHGSGKPVDKIIEEYANVWSFAAAETGLAVD
ncbi:MAG: prolyl oligopeptidase family serine peptidase [Pacificimonas sp.]